MRAYRSCASGRCGWRSSPVRATRWAVSSCPLWRNSSPSRRKTRLSGSCASWEDRVLISPGMRPRPGERLRRRLGAAHLFELRQLRLRTCSEPFPLVPLLHRLAEPARADERVAEHPVRGHGQGIEPERSEEHTSELQSRLHLVCRLLLEKKKKTHSIFYYKYYLLSALQH